MKRTITEKFDEKGNLIERVTVEEVTDAAPYVPYKPYEPIWIVPDYLQPPYIPTIWNGAGTTSCETVIVSTDGPHSITFTAQ